MADARDCLVRWLPLSIILGIVLLASEAGSRDASAQARPTFTYRVAETLVDGDADGLIDLPSTTEHLADRDLDVTVRLDVPGDSRCDEDVNFSLDGSPLTGTRLTGCEFLFALTEGSYELSFTAGAAPAVTGRLEISDYVIAVIGDSFAAGEGRPDLVDESDTARWQDADCHRSALSGHARAAAEIERGDPHSAVTLIHLACSGSRTGDVLQQIDTLRQIAGERDIDAVFLSAGGNDIEFASTVFFCGLADAIAPGVPCQHVGLNPDGRLRIPRQLIPGDSSPRDGDAIGEVLIDLPWDGVPEVVPPTSVLLCADASPGLPTMAVTDVSAAFPGGRIVVNPDPVAFRYAWMPPPYSWSFGIEAVRETDCGDQVFEEILEAESVAVMNAITTFGSEGLLTLDTPVPVELLVGGMGSLRRETLTSAAPLLATVIPRTLDEITVDRMEMLPERIGEIAAALEAAGVRRDQVWITEYPDPTGGDDGAVCDPLLDFLDEGLFALILGGTRDLRLELDGREAHWARFSMLGELNARLHESAREQGWNFVGGIRSSFTTHGLCAGTPWMHTIDASVAAQGDPAGAVHPNESGYEEIAAAILTSWSERGTEQDAAGFTVTVRGSERDDEQLAVASTAGLAAGDIVTIDGGLREEIATIRSIDPFAFEQPLGSAHEPGVAVRFGGKDASKVPELHSGTIRVTARAMLPEDSLVERGSLAVRMDALLTWGGRILGPIACPPVSRGSDCNTWPGTLAVPAGAELCRVVDADIGLIGVPTGLELGTVELSCTEDGGDMALDIVAILTEQIEQPDTSDGSSIAALPLTALLAVAGAAIVVAGATLLLRRRHGLDR